MLRDVDPVALFSPAKLNLSLAVTGRRADGFHDLISVAATLAWGYTLLARPLDQPGPCRLLCDAPDVPTDESNLVLRAATLFRAETGWHRAVEFTLQKHIPVGAGLGGGSGNAVAALRALALLSGLTPPPGRLHALAAQLGSDCPLFLADTPVVMRGRGEHLEPLPPSATTRVRGRRVLVCKPGFGIETGPAYQALAARPDHYASATDEETRLAAWLADTATPLDTLLANTFEKVVFPRWPALPVMAGLLRERHGLQLRLSGSGSACFALLAEDTDLGPVAREIHSGWGDSALVVDTRLN